MQTEKIVLAVDLDGTLLIDSENNIHPQDVMLLKTGLPLPLIMTFSAVSLAPFAALFLFLPTMSTLTKAGLADVKLASRTSSSGTQESSVSAVDASSSFPFERTKVIS